MDKHFQVQAVQGERSARARHQLQQRERRQRMVLLARQVSVETRGITKHPHCLTIYLAGFFFQYSDSKRPCATVVQRPPSVRPPRIPRGQSEQADRIRNRQTGQGGDGNVQVGFNVT